MLTYFLPKGFTSDQKLDFLRNHISTLPYTINWYCEECGERHEKTSHELAGEIGPLAALLILASLVREERDREDASLN